MYAAHHDVFRVLYGAGRLEADGAGPAIARSERSRYESMGLLAGRLFDETLLRPDLTRERAAHVIWLLASFDAYDSLASGRGLAPDEIVEILTDTAEHALLSWGEST